MQRIGLAGEDVRGRIYRYATRLEEIELRFDQAAALSVGNEKDEVDVLARARVLRLERDLLAQQLLEPVFALETEVNVQEPFDRVRVVRLFLAEHFGGDH